MWQTGASGDVRNVTTSGNVRLAVEQRSWNLWNIWTLSMSSSRSRTLVKRYGQMSRNVAKLMGVT